jgi:hypothetical protein
MFIFVLSEFRSESRGFDAIGDGVDRHVRGGRTGIGTSVFRGRITVMTMMVMTMVVESELIFVSRPNHLGTRFPAKSLWDPDSGSNLLIGSVINFDDGKEPPGHDRIGFLVLAAVGTW